MRTFVSASLVVATFAPVATAQSPKDLLEGGFSGAVRRELRAELDKLGRVEWTKSWGHTAEVWTGKTTVEFQGINSKIVKIMERVNDGEWYKAWVDPQEQTFDIEFFNFRKTPGKQEVRFHFDVKCQMRGQAEYRKYKSGVKLISVTGKGRATLRAHVDMRVYLFENGTRLGWETTAVDFKYSDVVLEKIGAVGGKTAELLGDAFTAGVKQWFPEKEREARAAVRTSISNALKGSQPIRNDVAKMIRSIR
jgi:hypothetical protein